MRFLLRGRGACRFLFSSWCWTSLEPDGHENIVANHWNSGACIIASNVVTSTGREELATSTLSVIRQLKFRQETMKQHATRQLSFQCTLYSICRSPLRVDRKRSAIRLLVFRSAEWKAMVWQMVHRTVTMNTRKSKAVSGNRCINVQRVGLIHTRLILCLIHYFISRLDSKIICGNTILFPITIIFIVCFLSRGNHIAIPCLQLTNQIRHPVVDGSHWAGGSWQHQYVSRD